MKTAFFAGMLAAFGITAGCFALVCYGADLSSGKQMPRKEIVYSMAQDIDRQLPGLEAAQDQAFLEMTKRSRK